jgi:hypothetical protein
MKSQICIYSKLDIWYIIFSKRTKRCQDHESLKETKEFLIFSAYLVTGASVPLHSSVLPSGVTVALTSGRRSILG